MTPILTLALFAALQAVAPGAPDSARAAAPSAPMTAAAAKPLDMDKVVCRRVVETGSRLGGATQCATKAQWRLRELDNAEYVRGAQSKGFQPGSPH